MPVWNGIRLSLLAAIAALLIAPAVAAAAPFNVNRTADENDGECKEDCTLREAVSLAGPADQVVVPAGTYVLTDGELFLTSDTIVGADARTTIIDGGAKSRVLWVTDGTTKVSGVTIRNGNGVGVQVSGPGGGIYVQSGVLQLTDSTVTANTATSGGGIWTAGTAILVGTTVSGNAAGGGRLPQGGGIGVAATGGLALGNSTVSNNRAVPPPDLTSQGGGVYSGGSLSVINATIAGNSASTGGGLFVVAPPTGSPNSDDSIFSAGEGGACGGPGVAGMTGDGNIASDGTCSFKGSGNRFDTNPTIAGLANNGGPTNTHALLPGSPAIDTARACTATDQRGVARPQPTAGLCDVGAFEYRAPTLRVVTNVANNSGGTATPAAFKVHVLLGKTEVTGSPQLGTEKGTTYTLDANQTYTVAADLPAGYSATIGGDCAPNGNVGLIEGQKKTCTIRADDVAPDAPATLTVVANVVNDDGGTAVPGDLSVHVRRGGSDVAGSPRPGSPSGTTYTLDAGAHSVAADPIARYELSVGGDCAADGSVTLASGDARTCTVTANDVKTTISAQLPPPVPKKEANAVPASGTVKIKLPGSDKYVTLADGQQIPVGTVIDVRKGRVTITAAADTSGGRATADFYGGIARLGQTGARKLTTVMTLVEALICPKAGRAIAAAKKKKKKRRLWGDGSGRFRTKGKHSAATVVGTKWLVEDRCHSTLTRVARGKVSVRDFAKKKTVIVRAGKKYVARAKNR